MSRKMTLRSRALFTGACALTLVACGHPPGPQVPPTQLAPVPASPVTVPVGANPGGLPGNPISPSDDPNATGQVGPVPAAQPAAPPEPTPAAPPLPAPGPAAAEPCDACPPGLPAIPTPLAIAGPMQIAFTSKLDFGGIDVPNFTPFDLTGFQGLFVYDDGTKDNFDVPGAGVGVENPQMFAGGSRIVFNRADGTIWFYDLLTELLVQFNDVNFSGLFVIRPSITQDGTVMTYVGVPGWNWSQGIAFIWINGVVAALSKVNAVGLMHGGISWIRISANGRWAVFTTADGALFTYDVVNPLVFQVTDAQVASFFATDPDISPDGSQIVWTGIGLDGRLRIFRYDRVAQLVDPMPFANVAMGALDAFDPRFLGPDSSWLTYDVFTRSNFGGFRVLGYNWITEFVRTFTILNSVEGEGNQLISDTNS